ncbi:aminoglycoside phosphotransferase family protein [Streptomyces sp. NBC_00859]|uniref:aminoglycoside phosphotransferase family protein n=1 Tax=Streptomyces sp. NBC_00859 TaxID=2903682 RepID=UPI00386B56E4|nr:aminoglycoside phosphotransferase family protein [Streptomyces sp. NBC_00859]
MATAEAGRRSGNRARLIARFGPMAGPWYDALPALVDGLARRWGLDVGEAGGGGTSRVYRCSRHRDGDSATVWLKLTPDPVVAGQEAEALTVWSGAPSVVRLLDSDLGVGALLLAGVEPGTQIREHVRRTEDVARLLVDLRTASRTRTPRLPPLGERINFLYDMAARRGTHGPEPVARGRAAALALAGTGPADGLVHGDLHPGNVLVGPAGRLIAIDPRPALGDPDFDVVDWAIDGVTDERGLRCRIAALAALVPGMSADRVLGWCRATAPLSAGAPAFLLDPAAVRRG